MHYILKKINIKGSYTERNLAAIKYIKRLNVSKRLIENIEYKKCGISALRAIKILYAPNLALTLLQKFMN